MAKQKKIFCLSNEAMGKLQILANNSNISRSKMLEALIMMADENLVVIEKKEFFANIGGAV